MASEIKVDTVSEKTSANGVTIDGVNIKDSKIVTANSVDSDVYVDGSIDTAHIADLNVTTGKIAADAITGAKIADNAINSEHYTDGSIDTAHIADAQVTTAKLATALFTGATDIGADIADADLFLMDDGAGGTIRKTAASRLKTYATGNFDLLHEAAVTGETGGSDDYTDAAYFHATNYDRYIVYIDEYEPQNDGSNLLLQLYLGDALRTTNYEYHTKLFQSNSDAAVNRSADTSSIRIIDDTGNASTESARGWFEYTSHETDNAAFLKMIKYSFVSRTSGDTLCGGWGVGSNEASSGALYGFRLLPSAGGLGNYKIRIYGIKS